MIISRNSRNESMKLTNRAHLKIYLNSFVKAYLKPLESKKRENSKNSERLRSKRRLREGLKEGLKKGLKSWLSKEEMPSTFKAAVLSLLVGLFLVLPELACAADHAGAFGDAATAISSMLKGTLGKTIALSALTLGVVSSAIRFNGPVLLGSCGVAAAVGLGPGIIDKLI